MTPARPFAELKAKGVKFKDAQPLEAGWAFAADLLDPDGKPFHDSPYAQAFQDCRLG